MNFDLECLCRLNGKTPTMRDQWKAFYRLYRMAHRDDMWFMCEDCFRILLEGRCREWILLVNDCGDSLESNRVMPIAIRQQRVRRSRLNRWRENPTPINKLLHAIFNR
jgi:hypothetical protein